MEVLFFVLNDETLLQPLLEEFNNIGVRGCTILDSNGMGRELAKKSDVFGIMFGSLRSVITPDLNKNKLLMLALNKNRVHEVVDAIERIVGSLENPETGVVFTIPISYAKGIKI